MSEIRSIFAYVENKCYDGLYDAAARYIARNWNNMDLESPRVPDIHTANWQMRGFEEYTFQTSLETTFPLM